MSGLAWEYLHLGLTTLNRKPIAPHFNRQLVSHPNHTLRKGAVLAMHDVLDCEIVCLAWKNEPIAGKPTTILATAAYSAEATSYSQAIGE